MWAANAIETSIYLSGHAICQSTHSQGELSHSNASSDIPPTPFMERSRLQSQNQHLARAGKTQAFRDFTEKIFQDCLINPTLCFCPHGGDHCLGAPGGTRHYSQRVCVPNPLHSALLGQNSHLAAEFQAKECRSPHWCHTPMIRLVSTKRRSDDKSICWA